MVGSNMAPTKQGALGTRTMLLPAVRHAIFIFVHSYKGVECEIDLLGFQNHPQLLHLVRMGT